MGKTTNNSPLKHTSGRIAKVVIYKTYEHGTVTSKYPDMSNIVASEKQKLNRTKFEKAVAFAKVASRDPEQSHLFKANKKKGRQNIMRRSLIT